MILKQKNYISSRNKSLQIFASLQWLLFETSGINS